MNRRQMLRKVGRARKKERKKLADLGEIAPSAGTPAVCTNAMGKAYYSGRRWIIAVSKVAAENAGLRHGERVVVSIGPKKKTEGAGQE